MAAYTSSNTSPERWKKIVEGADSGRHPEIMVDDGKLVAVSIPSVASARIQSFLTDVFKDGDNEWFKPASDTIESNKGDTADDGQPESSEKKKKKINLTQQRAIARQEKKDKGEVKQRAEVSKEGYSTDDWAKICTGTRFLRPHGIFLEGGKVVATSHTVPEAEARLHVFVAGVLGQETEPIGTLMHKGSKYQARR